MANVKLTTLHLPYGDGVIPIPVHITSGGMFFAKYLGETYQDTTLASLTNTLRELLRKAEVIAWEDLFYQARAGRKSVQDPEPIGVLRRSSGLFPRVRTGHQEPLYLHVEYDYDRDEIVVPPSSLPTFNPLVFRPEEYLLLPFSDVRAAYRAYLQEDRARRAVARQAVAYQRALGENLQSLLRLDPDRDPSLILWEALALPTPGKE